MILPRDVTEDQELFITKAHLFSVKVLFEVQKIVI